MEDLKRNVQGERVAILNANPQLFYMGNSSEGLIHDYGTDPNNLAFDANMNMMDGGFIVPPPGYNPNPTDGYIVDPAQGYNNINPAGGSNANSLGAHGFGGNGPQGFGGGVF
ncbi:hypothetical protein V6N13_069432 [Hibiscus sabdariffa]|uniref:Uncharacterized protein n=1 Tax=Hibiscus sabdariffa TaxID=183260 RepID=A0ABR2PGA6_9ROSI